MSKNIIIFFIFFIIIIEIMKYEKQLEEAKLEIKNVSKMFFATCKQLHGHKIGTIIATMFIIIWNMPQPSPAIYKWA